MVTAVEEVVVAVDQDMKTKVVDMVVKEEAMVATIKGEMWVEVTVMREIITNSNNQRHWGVPMVLATDLWWIR